MAIKISERFCAGDSDLTISSSDGVLFKLHRKHLEVHSDVFADAENATLPANGADEVVVLSETSSVLDVLFQYMYRQPQPNLQLVEFSVFAGVAEAAEKYMVYSALPAVLIRMREYLGSYPLQVLDYAARHNYKDLANKAVRSTVGLTLAEAGKNLSPDTFLKWATFYDTWHTKARTLLSFLIIRHQYSPGNLVDLAAYVKDPKLCYSSREKLERLAAAAGTPDQTQWLDSKFMPD